MKQLVIGAATKSKASRKDLQMLHIKPESS